MQGEIVMQQFTVNEIILVRQLLSLINEKLYVNKIPHSASLSYDNTRMITTIPRATKSSLKKSHYTAKDAVQYLGKILRSR